MYRSGKNLHLLKYKNELENKHSQEAAILKYITFILM